MRKLCGPAEGASERASLVIDAERPIFLVDWQELVEKRDVFRFLALRDIKVRFKQTILGSAWAISNRWP